ncbi:PadR family transcriptional regulator [Micromonospora sp. DT46]|uniref:PadR family transcriptional regulator n=1 Tax=unclassified Micromonospora TaxID=2617518 RepID=UPI00124B18CD|nr:MULTISPECIES: helix-turn-helix transcriptional regulator [unclassified Micromonospora]KAB1154129.1 PadR family transcriptional regulator [Micromonospora sp. AMSO12t]WSG02656.1 PadR family transcriptional regulator [Micromonospora sp. NBC_01740]
MAIQHAVLALLASGPSYGYELKGAFEEAVGPQWGPLNIGHLYQILDRLSRDGLVVAERQPQPVKPDRVVYEITPEGRAELDRWLGEPSPRSGGFRDDFFLKVTAAARSGEPATVRTVLGNQRGHLMRELRNLDGLRRRADDPVVGLLLSAASRHVEADLAFVDDAEQVLLADGGAALARLRAPRSEAVPPERGTGPTRAAG